MKWNQLAAIQIGGAICLPVLLIGFELGRLLPKMEALLAILIGNLVITLLALPIARLAATKCLTTSDSMELVFGKMGAKVTALLLLSCLLVWFSIQTQLIVTECTQFLHLQVHVGVWYLLVMLVAGITFLTTYKGIQAIGKVASYAVPVLCFTLVASLISHAHTQQTGFQLESPPFSLLSGIVMVIGCAIFAVIDLPTYFREAKNPQEAQKATIASFLVGLTLVEATGVILSQPGKTLLESLALSSSIFWSLWLVFFIFVAGWTTNVANLYSSIQAAKTLLERREGNLVPLTVGALGLLFCALPTLGDLPAIMDLFATTIIALGSLLFTVSLGVPLRQGEAKIALFFGMLLGFIEWFFNYSVSGVGMVDILFTTPLVALFINLFSHSAQEQIA